MGVPGVTGVFLSLWLVVVCEVLVAVCSATSTAAGAMSTCLLLLLLLLEASLSMEAAFTVTMESLLLLLPGEAVVTICSFSSTFSVSNSLSSAFSLATITGEAGTPSCCRSTSSTSSTSSSTLSTGSSLMFLVFSMVLLITDSSLETLSSISSSYLITGGTDEEEGELVPAISDCSDTP